MSTYNKIVVFIQLRDSYRNYKLLYFRLTFLLKNAQNAVKKYKHSHFHLILLIFLKHQIQKTETTRLYRETFRILSPILILVNMQLLCKSFICMKFSDGFIFFCVMLWVVDDLEAERSMIKW